MEMGRERPRSPTAHFAPRPASGVAHAPVSVPTLSGRTCPNMCPDRRPILSTICRTFWTTKMPNIRTSSTLRSDGCPPVHAHFPVAAESVRRLTRRTVRD